MFATITHFPPFSADTSPLPGGPGRLEPSGASLRWCSPKARSQMGPFRQGQALGVIPRCSYFILHQLSTTYILYQARGRQACSFSLSKHINTWSPYFHSSSNLRCHPPARGFLISEILKCTRMARDNCKMPLTERQLAQFQKRLKGKNRAS